MTTKQQTALLPVYLVVGEDQLKRDTVIKRLRARLEPLGDLAFNSDFLDGETITGSEIVGACNTLPFASEVRLVEVKNADKLKKADSEEIVSYLASPCESTILVLLADKLAKSTRLYKAVQAHGAKTVIDCTPLKKYELPKTVRSMAVTHGVTMTEGAAAKLVELIGESTVHLDSEVKKLALAHRGNDAITEHEVVSMVGRITEVKPWEFVDAFSARDLGKCITYLGRMQSVSRHALIAQCTTRIRELICARTLAQRGESGSLAKTLGGPDWRYKNHVRWAKGFTQDELRNALLSARDTERAMKSGSDPDAAFLDWIMAVCKK